MNNDNNIIYIFVLNGNECYTYKKYIAACTYTRRLNYNKLYIVHTRSIYGLVLISVLKSFITTINNNTVL